MVAYLILWFVYFNPPSVWYLQFYKFYVTSWPSIILCCNLVKSVCKYILSVLIHN